MKILHSFDELYDNEGSAVTVGKFDGLHMGHEKLVEKIVNKKSEGLRSIVVTFERMSDNTILKKSDKLLMTKEEKETLFAHSGVDILLELPFDRHLMQMRADLFVKNLSEKLHMKYLIVGDDFHFGYKGAGNTGLLQELSDVFGYEVDVIKKIQYEDAVVSSTRVRNEIKNGNIELANDLLGHPYFLIGKIIHGNQIGSTKIGRPTINIQPSDDKLLPPNGVYVTKVEMTGRIFHGVTNIGLRPTIIEEIKHINVETHILDFNNNVYDNYARVMFFSFLRPEMKFENLGELSKQIENDIHTTYIYFNQKK